MKTLMALTTVAALSLAGSAFAGQVFSDDFQSGSTTGFTGGSIQTSPSGTAKFLGPFAQGGSTTLSLSGLATHTSVTISFDVDVLLSMDGDGEYGGGRDQFLVTSNAASMPTLLDNDYANYPGNTQDNGGQGTPTIPGHYAIQTGSDPALLNTFGYAFDGNTSIDDSVYHYTFTFADADSALDFTFKGNTSEDVSNEFYGIDNVTVSTNAVAGGVPEPATWALMLLGFAVVGSVQRARVRRASIAA